MVIPLSFFRSETSQRLRAEGRAEGRAETILLVLKARGIDVPHTARERITSCTDMDTLRTWLIRTATADTTEDVFAETGD